MWEEDGVILRNKTDGRGGGGGGVKGRGGERERGGEKGRIKVNWKKKERELKWRERRE